jgi:hypothetical protein
LKIEDKINREEKQCHTSRISEYIADTIAINFKYYKNNHNTTFDTFFKQGFDTFKHDCKEKNEMYDMIENSLQRNYNLIRINKGFDKPLVLKDLNEEE